MSSIDRRNFLRVGALATMATALGIEAQMPVRLTKETWVLQQTPESRELIAQSGILSRMAGAVLNKHPLVHEYFRLGDICIQGFGADRFTGQRLEFDQAGQGLIQAFAMTLKESEADRTRHNHPALPSRSVQLTGSLAKMGQTELLGVLLDTAAGINGLQLPYKYLTTNSNKVYVTLAARLGLCPPNNCSSEVEEVKPYALFGADLPFHIVGSTTKYQTMAKQGKGAEDIRRAFNTDHMKMFPNALADLKSIAPRNSQDMLTGFAV